MKEYLKSFTKLEFDKIKSQIEHYVSTEMGRERVRNLTPSSCLLEIEESLSLVSEMKNLLETEGELPIATVSDSRLAIRRTLIEDYVLPASELRDINILLENSRILHQFITQRKKHYPLIYESIKLFHINKVLEYNISQAIDENGQIRNTASKELEETRKQIVQKYEQLRKRLESILKSVSEREWTQEDIITTREGRMVIPIKTEHKYRIAGFIHSTSASGATVFVEPTETLELNNEIRSLQFKEQREIEKILKALSDQVRDYAQDLLTSLNILGNLDFIYAKAKYAIKILGTKPNFSKSKGLRIINAKHPLLLLHHSLNQVVPLSIHLENTIRTIVITGPNAGGKTVALKTIGILSIMAQSGCLIPAAEGSEIPLFTDIFVDIGDEQSIENDLSSFSSHLKNMKEIVELATENSLVLIDEIGSGTDPNEGFSLSAAILEHLTKRGAFTIATTHHSSLKSFAFHTNGIVNAAMEFDHNSLRPTYRFSLGQLGSSYAMEMAERIMLPPYIIQKARELRGSDAYSLDKLIVEMQKQTKQLSETLCQAQNDKNRYSDLVKHYEDKVSSLNKELKDIKIKAINEAQTLVKNARAGIEQIIREIREHAAEREIIKGAREQYKKLEQDIKKLKDEISVEDETTCELEIGDEVQLKGSNLNGKIIDIVDKSHYLVLSGDLKFKVHKKDIKKVANVKRVKQKPVTIYASNNTEVKREIDLRGMYADSAINAIDKLIDDAVLYGLHRVDIIHGKGKGVLRKKIAEYLKKNPSVKSFRLGEWNEGGSGVTVVEIL